MLWQARRGFITGRGALDAAAGGGGGSPTLTYIGATSPSYAGNVATSTAAAIGTAAADRLVVVVFFDFNSGSANSSATATIGGNSATVHTTTNSTNGNIAGIASLTVTTGTTADIVVTYGSAAGGIGSFQVYTLTGLSSTTPTGAGSDYQRNATNPQTATTNIATTSGGVIIAGSLMIGAGNTVAHTGSTETFTDDVQPINLAGSTSGFVSHATGISTNASSNVSSVYTWSPGFTSSTLTAAAWR